MPSCSSCGGSGRVMCGVCHGSGDAVDSQGNLRQCPRCGGSGNETCPRCGGSGETK